MIPKDKSERERLARSGIRFKPPRVQVPPEVDWLLVRAFGRRGLEASWTERLENEQVLGLGEKLGLLARVRARTPRDLLVQELSLEILGALDRRFHGTAALLLLHEEVCREIAEVASDHGHPLMFLKGVALGLLEVTAPGARPVGDIDVLVPKEDARGFHETLLARGCRSPGLPGPDYHLPVIHHPLGSAIEVHHQLSGVRLKNEADAVLEDCLEADLCDPAPGMPEGCFVPSEPLLVAYLLAHGLGTHGKTPELYPGLQLLADLQDLGYSPAGGKRLPSEVSAWIGTQVSDEEAAAVLGVLGRLEVGDPGSEIVQDDEDSGLLLRHLLAGHLDDGYARSLKLVRRLEAPTGGGWLHKLWKNTWHALWLTPEQIDIVYGRPQSRIGYFGWRLWRPFDLLGRSVRAAWSWAGSRRRH